MGTIKVIKMTPCQEKSEAEPTLKQRNKVKKKYTGKLNCLFGTERSTGSWIKTTKFGHCKHV